MSETGGARRKRETRQNRLRAIEARAAGRRRFATALLLLAVCGLAAAACGWYLSQPRSDRHRAIKVRVRSGEAGQALERAGVIRSALAFDLISRWRGDAGKFRPGVYTLSPTMTLAQVARQLRLGPGHSIDDIVHVSIPPGFTVRQIAARLEREGVTDGTQFLQLAMNPDTELKWTYPFPRPPGPLEGYLYPDTYDFLPNTPAEKVLDEMLLNFSRRFYRPYQHQLAARGSSLHRIVTIASLIEREAKKQEDRPRIAGVLENRLNEGMRLEIDATVLYALGHHKQRVLYKDLLVDSPYNTYRHAGLPPGPIASPGPLSLMAALEPEKNDYLYYVARPTGFHYFTRNRKEHEAAVRQARSEWAVARSAGADSGGKPDESTN